MRTAQIQGTQRTVVAHSVRPARSAHGSAGIPLNGGKTLPFIVARSWSAPAGTYREAFYLIDPKTREVLFEAPAVDREIWGLQAMTEVVTEVSRSLKLQAGTYAIVFGLGGILGGEFPVEAFEVPS